MGSFLASISNACERNQRWIAKVSLASALIFACVAGGAQQFTDHYKLKWDTEVASAGLWEHVRLDLLAVLFLAYAVVLFCLLLHQHKRWAGFATALTSFVALIYFGGAAIAHGHAALHALSPGTMTVSG